jgi:hypothetical protein
MKRLKIKMIALLGRTSTRATLVVGSLAALFLVPASNAFATEEAGGATSGSSIAKDFIEPLTTKFTEALPVVIGFLVLVAAVVMVIKFVQSRGKSKTV